MDRRGRQRQHYDELVRTERPTRYLLSCGFRDRYDPTLLERRPALRRAVTRLLDRALPARGAPLDTILDLGCGTGYYWPLLRPRCRRLLGVDLSPAMAARGMARPLPPPAAMVAGEAGRLPVADGSVDLALAVDALHHLDDLRATLDELRRVLRPGGWLVAVEPNVFNPLVLLAHLVPPEERGALFPNHPPAVEAALRERFDEVEVAPVTYVSGIEDARALKLVEGLEPLFERWPLRPVALRRLYRARRRAT